MEHSRDTWWTCCRKCTAILQIRLLTDCSCARGPVSANVNPCCRGLKTAAAPTCRKSTLFTFVNFRWPAPPRTPRVFSIKPVRGCRIGGQGRRQAGLSLEAEAVTASISVLSSTPWHISAPAYFVQQGRQVSTQKNLFYLVQPAKRRRKPPSAGTATNLSPLLEPGATSSALRCTNRTCQGESKRAVFAVFSWLISMNPAALVKSASP